MTVALRSESLLEVRDLGVRGPGVGVEGLSFRAERGRVLVLLGESGAGLSTVAGVLAGQPLGRRFAITGDVVRGGSVGLASVRPAGRRESVAEHLAAACRARHPRSARLSRGQAREHVAALLRRAGGEGSLGAALLDEPMAGLSAAASRRVALAAALCGEPAVLVVDDLLVGLDATARLALIERLRTLRDELDAALVVVTGDPTVAVELGDEVVVAYAGRVVEQGSVRSVLGAPEHPYVWGLLGSIPRSAGGAGRRRLRPIKGNSPSAGQVVPGCAFQPRCPFAQLAGPTCQQRAPELSGPVGGHRAACHLAPELRRRMWVSDIKPGLEPR